MESQELTKLLKSLGIDIPEQPNTPSTAFYQFLSELPQGVVDILAELPKEDLNDITSNMAKLLPGDLYTTLSDQSPFSQEELITLSLDFQGNWPE